MASVRTKTVSRRKPATKRTSVKRKSTVAKKKPVARKTTAKKVAAKSKTLYAVDSKGRKSNIKIVVQ